MSYCSNTKRLNNSACRPLFLDDTCECLGDSYSGRHCARAAGKTIVHAVVASSISIVAIIAMDILKYFFGIDPVYRDRVTIQNGSLQINAIGSSFYASVFFYSYALSVLTHV